MGRLDPPRGVTADIDRDFQKFDRALKTQVRPVLVSLQRLPFRDFTAEEFLGRTLTTCRRRRLRERFSGKQSHSRPDGSLQGHQYRTHLRLLKRDRTFESRDQSLW